MNYINIIKLLGYLPLGKWWFVITLICISILSCSGSSDNNKKKIDGSLVLVEELNVNRDSFQFDRFTVDEKANKVVLVGNRDGVYTYDFLTDDLKKIVEAGNGPDRVKVSLFAQPVVYGNYIFIFDRTPQGGVNVIENGKLKYFYSYADDLGGITPFIGSSFVIRDFNEERNLISILVSCSTNPPQVSSYLEENTLALITIGLESFHSENNWLRFPLATNTIVANADADGVEFQAFLAPYLVAVNKEVLLKFTFDYDVYKYYESTDLVEKPFSFTGLYDPVKAPRRIDGGTKEGGYKMFYSNLFVEGFSAYQNNLVTVYTETVDLDLAPSNKAEAREYVKTGRVIHFYDTKTKKEKIFSVPDFASGTNFMFYDKVIIFMSQNNAVDGKMLYFFENPMSI